MNQAQDSVADELVLNTRKQPSGCIEWIRGAVTAGYGEIRIEGTQRYTHRVSFEIFIGPIPPGLFVLHRCDNPPCINPAHLFVGTALDNIRDCKAKGRMNNPGRSMRGEKNPSAKLTEERVREIRSRYIKGVTKQRDLAREYGLCQATIKEIVNRQIWRHI